MEHVARRRLPRWLCTILAVGGLVACGIYLGKIHLLGAQTPDLLRSIGFGVFGLLMLWGALTRS